MERRNAATESMYPLKGFVAMGLAGLNAPTLKVTGDAGRSEIRRIDARCKRDRVGRCRAGREQRNCRRGRGHAGEARPHKVRREIGGRRKRAVGRRQDMEGRGSGCRSRGAVDISGDRRRA